MARATDSTPERQTPGEPREIHLELLLGKPVRDRSGHMVGHIEEAIAERRGGEWVVSEYLVGPGAVVERLSARPVARFFREIFGSKKGSVGHRIRWDQLDLSDPEKPLLTCDPKDLEEFTD